MQLLPVDSFMQDEGEQRKHLSSAAQRVSGALQACTASDQHFSVTLISVSRRVMNDP